MPNHLSPDRCFVCGGLEHPSGPLHNFWSNAEAAAHFDAEDAVVRSLRYPSGASNPAADYVAQHRPY